MLLERADLILHVGDFTAAAVLEELRELAPVEAVHGNMDEPALRERLPERSSSRPRACGSASSTTPAPCVAATSASPPCSPAATSSPTATRTCRRSTQASGTWIVNPGSPTERRRAPFHSLAVLRGGEPELVRLD